MVQLPPGPRFAPLQTLRFVRDMDRCFAECARRYGDPFTLPTLFGTMVVTGQPDAVKEVFGADPDLFEAAGSGPMRPLVGANSLFLLSGARHRRERKLLMPPFHGERMRAYGQLMHDTTLSLTAHWRRGERVVMQEVTQDITLDLIIRTVFGVDNEEGVARFRRLARGMMDSINPVLLFSPMLQRDFIPSWRRFLDLRAEFFALLQEQIDRRRSGGSVHEDILALLLAARTDEGSPLSDDELKDELITMLSAGHETTSLSLAWALFWIHREPHVLERLVDELGQLGASLDPEALARLPYLGAVCDESLRLQPVAALAPRTLVAPFRLRGFDLPSGTMVAVSMTLAHHQREAFPEPTAFRPERFLERKYSPFEYIPFGGGSRRCLGAAFATYEMRVVLGTLLARRRLSLPSRVVPRSVRRGITFGPADGIPMIYEGPRAS